MRYPFLLLFLTIHLLFSSDEMCIGSTSRTWEFAIGLPPIKAKEHIFVKANVPVNDITVNVLSKDFKSLFSNNIFSSTDILLNGNKKSNENDNPDKVCSSSSLFGECKSYTEDPDYRANILDNYDLESYLPFLNNGSLLSLMGNISLWSDGITYNLPDISQDETSDLGKEFLGLAAIKNFIGSFFFSNTLVLGTYTTNDGVLHENVILNPCGTEVPSLSIEDNTTAASDNDKILRFNINITGEISGHIADSYKNKSYIHYYTQDGTASAGTDYESQNGTLIINKGDTTADINITIKGGGGSGKFYVILDNALGAKIIDGNATGTITPPPPPDETIPADGTNTVNAQCGTFEDMFQTHGTCSGSSGGTISFTNAGQTLDGTKNIILDNSDNTLNTCNISTANWVKNQYETCGAQGDCTQSGASGTALNIDYNNLPQTAAVSNAPSSSNNDVTLDSTTTLSDTEYDDITTSWHTGTNTTFSVSSSLKINSLKMSTDNTFNFSGSKEYSLDIGTLGISSNGVRNTINTDTHAKNIKINNFNLPAQTTLTLRAAQTIKMDSFTVGRGSNVTLSAQYININNFTSSNSGNGNSDITIYADYIDIDTLTLNQTVTLHIYPYTPGKRVLVRVNTLDESSSSSILLSSGNYYVNTGLNIPGTSDISALRAMNQSQIINLYINSNLSLGNNPGINATGNKGNYATSFPAANFMIFINGDLTTGGGGTTINATIYVEGDATFGNPTYIKGALNANNTISIGQGQFIYDQSIADEGWGECGGSSTYITGPFDAWDTFRDNTSNPPIDRNISTKIVNKPFKLSLASLNKNSNAYELKAGIGSIDVAIYPNGSTNAISNQIQMNASTDNHIASSDNITVTTTSKNAVVGFKLCATYEHNATSSEVVYYLYPSASCSGQTILHSCDNTTTGTPTWHICYATDDFAIRPYAFRVFGENQYKRAGEDFNLTIKAVDENNASINTGTLNNISGTNGYNESLSSLNIISQIYIPSSAAIDQMLTDVFGTTTGHTAADISTCSQTGTFTVVSNNFINGESNISMKFSETGILDINISEKPGSEFAFVDTDDTNDAQRYITPATVINDESDISKNNILLFIPYSFVTTAEYNTTNGQNWLYMSHDVNVSNTTSTTPKMAAYISYTVEAKNKQGVTVKNYTKTCFPDTNEVSAPRVNGLKLNTTFDLFLDADINSTADANLSLYTEDNASNAIWTPNKSKTILENNNTLQEWISPLNFANGIGKAKVYFNIDRNISNARNPIKITLVDVNTSTSWMTNPGSPKDFNGTILGINKTFLYGRTHAQRQRFIGSDGNASIFYEIYCYGTDCNKTILPNSNISKSTDDPRWFINTFHDPDKSGNTGNIIQKGSISVVTTTNLSNTVGETKVSLHYDGTRGYPYKTTMENNASGWLIYNKYNANAIKNEFDVEFDSNSSQWFGVHESNTTSTGKSSSWINRRVDW